MYKSVDAGKTWTHIGLEDTEHISRVIVDPQNPDVVFVAALGHAYGNNEMRGVFRSDDGGKTWKKTLYKDDKTGAIDLVFDPHNSHVLFAALWEAHRTPWSLVSGGPGSGLYKSGDGGATWKRLEGHGLPPGVLGRIGVSVSGADGNSVYAIIEAEKGGIYRSEDGGESWHLVNPSHQFTQRAWYFHHIFADPKSVDTVYVLNTGLYRSTDGGRNFSLLRAPHGDHHGLWIDPANPNWIINSNDGGATISHNGGITWTAESNQPTAQFYHVATDTHFPYRVYGAQQDNSTVAIASRSDRGAIDRPDWYAVGGGEAGYVVPSPADPDTVYAGSYDGLITRYNHKNGQIQDITSWPLNPMGSGAAELKHRFQWTAPIALSPHDPNILYHGGGREFMSQKAGKSWTALRGDTPRGEKRKQGSSRGPLTRGKTTDYGKSWTKITNGLPDHVYVHAVHEDPKRKGLLFAGTEMGIYVSFDEGGHWQSLRLNLPATPIHDLTIKDDDLLAATHGRSFWVLDDINPIRQLTSDAATEDAHLFQPGPAVRLRGPSFNVPRGLPVGANPPSGAIVDYALKAAPKEPITLEISDAGGKVVRKFSSKKAQETPDATEDEFGPVAARREQLPTEAGLNRFVWDLRYEPPSKVPGSISWGGSPIGPVAVPGTYQLKLTVEGKAYTSPVEVKKDPRVEASQADLQKQLDLALRIRDRVTAGHDAVNQIRSVRDQLTLLKKRLAGDSNAKAVLDAADALNKKLDAIEEKIIQPKSKTSEDPLNYPIQAADQLMALQGTVESADTAPTAQSFTVFEELNGRLEAQLAAWRDVQSKDIAALNELIQKNSIPAIAPAKADNPANEPLR